MVHQTNEKEKRKEKELDLKRYSATFWQWAKSFSTRLSL
jgi:hypothetical protein